ncbi:caspase family protein [Streptomyces hainanensis]|uniref:Caspase family protein n=1 Tax=Streptomyces hainanensis TaxID=402648 RepID=A0A4R4TA91_9ACTN|nr:caspase family protein [Streptomyces hainanensis]TDC74057.1 caspase family protein [Streptomyces hainanensis]
MAETYALLIGVDAYPPEVSSRPLRGAVNDVLAARAWLAPRGAHLAEIHDAAATRDAIVAGIRSHLGRAGEGDTALLWFSGHGTELETADPRHQRVEAATGRCQALLAVDGPLVDKELGALLDATAAPGTHVVAVLDCCYSGGGTRDPELIPRYAPPRPSWRAPVATGRDAAVTAGHVEPRHALLAASRLTERAYEAETPLGEVRGVFSQALLTAAWAAGPAASCRELLTAAHARVRRLGVPQHPVLWPEEPGGPTDRPLLGGAAATEPSPYLLRCGHDGWEVTAGAAHGLRVGDPARLAFTVTGDGPEGGRTVRARVVEPTRTLVDARGWMPDDRRRAYPVAMSELPLPPATVTIDAAAAPAAAAWIRAAAAGSPLLRVTEKEAEDGRRAALGSAVLRLAVSGEGARVAPVDEDLPPVPELPLRGPLDATRVVDCLHHLARWRQLRDLDCPASSVSSRVSVEIVPWGEEEPCRPGGDGEYLFSYTGGPGHWREPWVSIRLRNRSSVAVWCVLLDLTDSYAANSVLFPGHFIGPGRVGHALDGDPVQLSLPASRPPGPGAAARDWLKLIVAEGELNTVPFHLAPWRPDATPAAREDAAGPGDGVLRLTSPTPSGSRDVGPATGTGHGGPGRWATVTLPLRTVVPVSGRGG